MCPKINKKIQIKCVFVCFSFGFACAHLSPCQQLLSGTATNQFMQDAPNIHAFNKKETNILLHFYEANFSLFKMTARWRMEKYLFIDSKKNTAYTM